MSNFDKFNKELTAEVVTPLKGVQEQLQDCDFLEAEVSKTITDCESKIKTIEWALGRLKLDASSLVETHRDNAAENITQISDDESLLLFNKQIKFFEKQVTELKGYIADIKRELADNTIPWNIGIITPRDPTVKIFDVEEQALLQKKWVPLLSENLRRYDAKEMNALVIPWGDWTIQQDIVSEKEVRREILKKLDESHLQMLLTYTKDALVDFLSTELQVETKKKTKKQDAWYIAYLQNALIHLHDDSFFLLDGTENLNGNHPAISTIKYLKDTRSKIDAESKHTKQSVIAMPALSKKHEEAVKQLQTLENMQEWYTRFISTIDSQVEAKKLAIARNEATLAKYPSEKARLEKIKADWPTKKKDVDANERDRIDQEVQQAIDDLVVLEAGKLFADNDILRLMDWSEGAKTYTMSALEDSVGVWTGVWLTEELTSQALWFIESMWIKQLVALQSWSSYFRKKLVALPPLLTAQRSIIAAEEKAQQTELLKRIQQKQQQYTGKYDQDIGIVDGKLSTKKGEIGKLEWQKQNTNETEQLNDLDNKIVAAMNGEEWSKEEWVRALQGSKLQLLAWKDNRTIDFMMQERETLLADIAKLGEDIAILFHKSGISIWSISGLEDAEITWTNTLETSLQSQIDDNIREIWTEEDVNSLLWKKRLASEKLKDLTVDDRAGRRAINDEIKGFADEIEQREEANKQLGELQNQATNDIRDQFLSRQNKNSELNQLERYILQAQMQKEITQQESVYTNAKEDYERIDGTSVYYIWEFQKNVERINVLESNIVDSSNIISLCQTWKSGVEASTETVLYRSLIAVVSSNKQLEELLNWQSALRWLKDSDELTATQLDAVIAAISERKTSDQAELDGMYLIDATGGKKIKYQQQHEDYLNQKIWTETAKWAYEIMIDAQLKLDELKTRKKYVDGVVGKFDKKLYQPLVLKSSESE